MSVQHDNNNQIPSPWVRNYFGFLDRYRILIQVFVAVLTVVSFFAASHLQLKTSFSELLPQKLPSVQSLNVATQRLGGTGVLVVGVESPSFAANRRFVEDLVPLIKPLVGPKLRYMEYRYNDVQDYAHKYALHYLDISQLRSLSKALNEEQVTKRKDEAFADMLGLDDEPKKSSEAPADPFASLDPSLRKFLDYREAYLSVDNGKILAISLAPQGTSLDVGSSKELMNQVRGYIDQLKPASYHPQMRVDFVGPVNNGVREFEAIKNDIVDTALLLVALIVAVLFVFFWSWRVIFFLGANLILAVIWTFGATDLAVGYLNTQTAFLGSLVAGTGINYGVIWISRFLELRRHGRNVEDSVLLAIQGTLMPTLIASATTAMSFAALFYASNKGFSQFGFIGGVGVALCWIAAMTLLPLWVYRYEKAFPKSPIPTRNPLAHLLGGFGLKLGASTIRHAKVWAVALLLLTIAMAPGVQKLFRDPLERNFDNLRNKVTATPDELAFRDRVGRIFATSWTPSLVFVDSSADARQICPSVFARRDSIPPADNVIEGCLGLFDLLPKPTADKIEQAKLFREIRTKLSHPLLKFSERADLLKQLREHMSFDPPPESALPEQITRRFTELDGRVGLFALVYPDNAKPLQDAKNLLAFTEGLSNVPLIGAPGKTFTAAGDSFVLADLLRNIHDEGPKVALIAFGGVLLIAVFLSGGLKAGALMSFCLILATWWMMGVQGYLGLKFNFFNFIALPLTFGIGVDYPINVFLRCKQEGFRRFSRIFVGSGLAVTLCSLTTAIGYYTLLGASSLALASFGKLALIGEFTCLLTALVVVPVVLRARGRFLDEA